ncbi:hypothetical protein PAXRUDRAFT_776587 [Paxillus rubicundulus Ve08.2h10]|uniref:Extracellular metalloproteinase n=1 Tax=Paxillus rubicundulus Ve08.2h10 TaxID=930991 RepID=A0A0D0DRK6_9AGAM|nr:hypothetical protein PAXRUDRAFT_776587 [Paxillus rubicundulus Ve08.2h10]
MFSCTRTGGRTAQMYDKRSEGSVQGTSTADSSLFPCRSNPAATEEVSMAEVQSCIGATVVQLFYTSNIAHDNHMSFSGTLLTTDGIYGFTETGGNVQQYNVGRVS